MTRKTKQCQGTIMGSGKCNECGNPYPNAKWQPDDKIGVPRVRGSWNEGKKCPYKLWYSEEHQRFVAWDPDRSRK